MKLEHRYGRGEHHFVGTISKEGSADDPCPKCENEAPHDLLCVYCDGRGPVEHEHLMELNRCRSCSEDFGWHDIEVEVIIPGEWEICDTCRGEGKVAFQGMAFTESEFYEDPDFAEDYWGGKYDKQCTDCNGTGKIYVPITDPAGMTEDQRKAIENHYDWLQMEAEDRRTMYYESGGMYGGY